jgi:hypothetical protein
MINVPATDSAQIRAETPPTSAYATARPVFSLRPASYDAPVQMIVSRAKARDVTTAALRSTPTGVVWLVTAKSRNVTEPIETTVSVTSAGDSRRSRSWKVRGTGGGLGV